MPLDGAQAANPTSSPPKLPEAASQAALLHELFLPGRRAMCSQLELKQANASQREVAASRISMARKQARNVDSIMRDKTCRMSRSNHSNKVSVRVSRRCAAPAEVAD
jgi:hypothetical protein